MSIRTKSLSVSLAILLVFVVVGSNLAPANASGSWATKASTPTPITGHAVGVAGGKLYSLGGSNGAPTFAYDPTTDMWTTKTTMSVSRKNLAAGVVNGILYAVGGDNNVSYFATNEAYNPATDGWTTKASMPTARSFPSAGVVNGILYVGGEDNITGTLTNVEAYDPASNTWSTKSPMSQRRSRGHGVAVVNGLLYVIGGYDTNPGMSLNTVEAYDPVTNAWTSKTPMPTLRHALAAVSVNGIIYAIGGFNGVPLSTVEAYHPATDTWTNETAMPTASASLSAAEINGVIYAVGGTGSSGTLTTVEAFTPTPSCVPPPSGMVSWWPGDGNANDIKDGNNGTLQGGATFAAGKVGQAFSFDGVNGRIIVPSASNLDLQQAFTIDAWVNFADLNSVHCIVCKGVVDDHQFALATGNLAANDVLELLVRRQASASDGLDYLKTVNQAHLVPNRWYHIVATADGTNKSIYLDGQLLATNSAIAPYTAFSPAVEIGSGNGGTVAFFHGLIDEVEIYNRALTQAEIQAIYNAGTAGKCKPPANNAPVVRCQNVTVPAEPSCTANASVDNGSIDPDGDPITVTQSPPGPYSLGSTSVTLTVTDSHGASSSCTAIVTVVDDTAPQITSFPADASYQCASQVPPATPSQASATDNCGTPTVTVSNSSNGGAGSPASPLIITRTYVATDAAGNHGSVSQKISVIDNTPPTVSCPTSPTTLSVGANCQAALPDVTGQVSASDNCTPSTSLTKSQNPVAGTMVGAGTQTITVTVTDAAGNSSSCAVTLNVVDNTPPTITCPSAKTVECAGPTGAVATFAATVSDNCDSNPSVACSPASGSVFPTGSSTVTCTAKDASNNSSSCSFIVTVADTTPPVVTLNGANPMTTECHAAFTDPGAIASDACAGSLPVTTSRSINANSVGTYTLTYSAIDPAGLTTTKTRTVNVVDTTPPTITLAGSTSMTVECHTTFTDPGASANDACAGDLSSRITVAGSVNVNAPGTYTLTYSVSDSTGNAALPVTRTINVVDTTAPSISCPSGLAVECAGSAGATATYSVSASDACDASAAAVCSPPSGSVFPSGSTTVSCTATDASGNSSSCSFTVTVRDTTPPVVTLNGANPMTVECHTSFTDPGATSSDTCAGSLPSQPRAASM